MALAEAAASESRRAVPFSFCGAWAREFCLCRRTLPQTGRRRRRLRKGERQERMAPDGKPRRTLSFDGCREPYGADGDRRAEQPDYLHICEVIMRIQVNDCTIIQRSVIDERRALLFEPVAFAHSSRRGVGADGDRDRAARQGGGPWPGSEGRAPWWNTTVPAFASAAPAAGWGNGVGRWTR